MKLTSEEKALLEAVRAKVAEGIPLSVQAEALSKLRSRSPRRRRTPDVDAAIIVNTFLFSVDYKYDILLRMQREVPRGRRTPAAIFESLKTRHPNASKWVQNGWQYLAIHLSEHRTKAAPLMTLKERAAIATLELDTHYEKVPDLVVVRAFIKSARERAKYASTRFRETGPPDAWRRQRENIAKLPDVRELAIGKGLHWALERHAATIANQK